MGCGKLDRVELFDHVLGRLKPAQEAALQEHVNACDPCRADIGGLSVIAERLDLLGSMTAVRGSDRFAEKLRAEARTALGGRPGARESGTWAAALTESQRLKRLVVRRRRAYVHKIKVALGFFVLAFSIAAMVFMSGLWDLAVDAAGPLIERASGADLASWGWRPSSEEAASKARSASPGEELKAVAYIIGRVLKWEFRAREFRPEAIVMLEIARRLAVSGKGPELVAILLEKSAGVTSTPLASIASPANAVARLPTQSAPPSGRRASDEARRPTGARVRIFGNASRLLRAGRPEEVEELLALPLADELPLAFYYAGEAAVLSGDRARAVSLFEHAAGRGSSGARVRIALLCAGSGDTEERSAARGAVSRLEDSELKRAVLSFLNVR